LFYQISAQIFNCDKIQDHNLTLDKLSRSTGSVTNVSRNEVSTCR